MEGDAPQIGDRFPAETLEAAGGQRIDLSALDGPAVIYFYPLDGTGTCTREAVEFNRAYPAFREAGVLLVGVSTDDDESHRCVIDEHGLAFPLVSDAERELSGRLGIVRDFGEHGMLAGRTTYLLDRDATIREVWRLVDEDVVEHPRQALAAARTLGGEG